MLLRARGYKQIKTTANARFWFWLLLGVSASGQTASDLNGKYPAVNAYEVRPGVLMTAKYAASGQVCEMTLQRYYSPGQPDADTTIPAKLENQLIDELAPAVERGPATSKWLRNSFTAGGVSHTERDFVNVLVVIDGTYWCTEEPDGKANCGHGGTKVITIQWKKRTCAGGKPMGVDKLIPAGNGEGRAGEEGKGKNEDGAGKETGAGGSPEGDGLSAPSDENFLPGADTGRQNAVTGQERQGIRRKF